MSTIAAARYGKDNVRVYKVHRDEKTDMHTVVEMTVCVLLEGDIETSCVPIIPFRRKQAFSIPQRRVLTGKQLHEGR